MKARRKPNAKRKMTAKQRHRLGLRLYKEGRMEEALEQIRAALKETETGELWNDWGAVQHALGAVDQAEGGFRRAFELQSDYLLAAANLGGLLVAEGRAIEAAPFLLAALNTTDEELRAGVESVIAQLSYASGTLSSGAEAAAG
jgi:Flp pilus assembly protein TadD